MSVIAKLLQLGKQNLTISSPVTPPDFIKTVIETLTAASIMRLWRGSLMEFDLSGFYDDRTDKVELK